MRLSQTAVAVLWAEVGVWTLMGVIIVWALIDCQRNYRRYRRYRRMHPRPRRRLVDDWR